MRTINVDNLKGDFFGGLPYNVSWDFGDGTTPSKLTVSVVNEKGTYQSPRNELGFRSPKTISIGKFKFNGYLIAYSSRGSADQKTLDLTYVDKSIDLDRYFVGLNQQYGDKKSTSSNNRLILLGKEYHPCDTDMDSTVEYDESSKRVIDTCDPCPDMPPTKYDFACDPILADFKIFPVYYTFNELIGKIPSTFNVAFSNANKYKNFKASYTGTLKDVLNSWCSDLGLAFYWDPFQNSLQIISRDTKLEISTEIPEDAVESELGGSVENTFSQGFIGYFAKDGEVKSYDCTLSTLENLASLTIKDLNSKEEKKDAGASGSSDYTKYEAQEIAAALSYYSNSLRNAFLWFNYYGILEAKDLEKYQETGDTESGKIPSQALGFFGNLSIKKVCAPGIENNGNEYFIRINKLLNQKDKDVLNLSAGKKPAGTLDKPNYYFFIGEMSEEFFTSESNREQSLGKDFMGKYWYSRYKATVPGSNNISAQVTTESPDGDGSGEWYYESSSLKNHPLFKFGHSEDSTVGKLVAKLYKSDKENEKAFQEFGKDTDKGKKKLLQNAFVLMERHNVWYPPEDQIKWYESLFRWYDDQIFQKFAQSDGRPPILYAIYPEAKENPNIKLYVARVGSKESFAIEKKLLQVKDHKAEIGDQKSWTQSFKKDTTESVYGEVTTKNICPYGLGPENKFVSLQVGDSKLEIQTPVGGFAEVMAGTGDQENPDYTSSGSDGNKNNANVLFGEEEIKGNKVGYDLVINCSNKFKKYLPKIQYVVSENPQKQESAAKVGYSWKEIQEDNLNLFKKNPDKSPGKDESCLPLKEDLTKYMEKYQEYTSFAMTDVQDSLTFKVAGVFPHTYGASDGLNSVQITVSDGGVFTTYTFEDKIIQPPSDTFIEQSIKDLKNSSPIKSIGNLNMASKREVDQYKAAVEKSPFKARSVAG
jgi:hypothetical protein